MSDTETDPANDATPRKASLLWPTVLTIVGLAILLSLGTWQMQRLAWKEALIARVEAAAKAAPVPLASIDATTFDTPTIDSEFRRVTLSGTFEHDKELHVWSPGKRGPAWSVVTPLRLATPIERDQKPPIERVLVNRGVVLDASKAVAMRAGGNPSGMVDIAGRVRLGHAGTFSSNADPARNQWYDYDLARMRDWVIYEATGKRPFPDLNIPRIAPFFVEAEAATGAAGAPQPDLAAVNLSNRHLEYALTWYGLAVTLAGVYLAWVFSRRRRSIAQ